MRISSVSMEDGLIQVSAPAYLHAAILWSGLIASGQHNVFRLKQLELKMILRLFCLLDGHTHTDTPSPTHSRSA